MRAGPEGVRATFTGSAVRAGAGAVVVDAEAGCEVAEDASTGAGVAWTAASGAAALASDAFRAARVACGSRGAFSPPMRSQSSSAWLRNGSGTFGRSGSMRVWKSLCATFPPYTDPSLSATLIGSKQREGYARTDGTPRPRPPLLLCPSLCITRLRASRTASRGAKARGAASAAHQAVSTGGHARSPTESQCVRQRHTS